MSDLKSQLDAIVRTMTGEQYAAELQQARKEYNAEAGESYEDDTSFEIRMIQFVEWFVFDRPLARGVVPIRAYLEEHGEHLPPDERSLTEALIRQTHGLYRVKKPKPPVLPLKGLWDGKTVRVEAGEAARSFQLGDLLEARLVVFEEKTWLTEGILCHPPGSEDYIKKEMKTLRKSGARSPESLFFRLSAMSLKYDRSRGIKPELIYRNT